MGEALTFYANVAGYPTNAASVTCWAALAFLVALDAPLVAVTVTRQLQHGLSGDIMACSVPCGASGASAQDMREVCKTARFIESRQTATCGERISPLITKRPPLGGG